MKSNTAILAECFAALTEIQLRRLAWQVEHKVPILCSNISWIVGNAAEPPGVLAVVDVLPGAGPLMGRLVQPKSVLQKFAEVHDDYDAIISKSTPRQVRMAIRRAARMKGIET